MDNKTLIGKDVIESLTIGMYDDARFIYREYIQNAADQIDKAREQGMLTDGEIHINIDRERKLIIIEDDATGIKEDEVAGVLKNIASSKKQRGVDKGFRGIGRLGGLAYCESLVFETSFVGEPVKSKLTWDALRLKRIINDRSQKEEATNVIDSVTSLDKEKESPEAHYFKVTLIGVTNEELLDVKEIRKYLSLVAPVPFSNTFVFASEIYRELKNDGIKLDEYKIYINTEQLFKGYNSYIYEGSEETNKKKIGEVIDVRFYKQDDKNNNKLLWCWYGITEKNQSLNQINYARGFRLRKANIQIGNEDTLTRYHRDRRFQFYFFGEVYGLHPDLIPNARRDNFSETETFYEFEDKLRSFFHSQIHKLCYQASELNSIIKTINGYNEVLESFSKKKEGGFIDENEKNQLLESVQKKKKEADKAEKKLQSIKAKSQETESPLNKIIEKVSTTQKMEVDISPIVTESSKIVYRTQRLSRLSRQQQKFLGEIFTVIKNVLPEETGELLIQKIEEKYK